MIQTVRNNFDNFTSEDIYKANISRKTQSMVANLTDDKFKEIVSGSNLNNFLVEVIYVSNSSAIFGSNRKRLRGASNRQKPKRVKEEYLKISNDFISCVNLLPWRQISCSLMVSLFWSLSH